MELSLALLTKCKEIAVQVEKMQKLDTVRQVGI